MNLKTLKQKYNLDELEVFTQDTSEQKVSFSANKLKQADLTQANGISIRVIKDKKVGLASGYGKLDLESLILKAIANSKYSPETNLKLPSNNHLSRLSDEKFDEEKLYLKFKEAGDDVIKTVLNEAPNVLVDVTFDLSKAKEKVENANDLICENENNIYSFSINIRETNESNFIEVFTANVESDFPDHKLYTNELIKTYKYSQKSARAKNGQYPILYTCKAAKELLGIAESALNGKMVVEKSSPWSDKIGKQVLSKDLSLIQDPNFGYMARKTDDEGVLIENLTLIKDGILENFYFDLSTAYKSKEGFKSTGNGFKASVSSQVEPSLLNIVVPKGKRSLDEIIKSIDYGLIVDQTMGGLTTNISGDMSVNIDTGFLIEKGEIIGRVKDTMISGNMYTALNNIIELSNSSRFYWSNVYNPDMLVSGLTISAE